MNTNTKLIAVAIVATALIAGLGALPGLTNVAASASSNEVVNGDTNVGGSGGAGGTTGGAGGSGGSGGDGGTGQSN
jgi:hypothetical protein